MEKLLRLWFTLSAALVGLFAGWSIVLNGWTPVSVIALAIGAALFAALIATRTTNAWVTRLQVGGVCTAFIAGLVIAQTNVGGASMWMQNSLVMLQSEIRPMRVYKGKTGTVAMTSKEQQLQAERLSRLRVAGNTYPKKVLVSFRTGLMMIDGEKTQYFNAQGARFVLSSLLPDGSFLYSSMINPDNIGAASINTEGLTRAVIEDGVLRKLWDWDKPHLRMHHWGDEHLGSVYMPGRQFANLPNALSASLGADYAECERNSGIRDVINIVDLKTGKVEQTIDLMEVLARFKEEDSSMIERINDCFDPLHLNDVQVVKSPDVAKYIPNGKIGDMLVSARNISTIFILDRDTHEVKWYVSGLFKRQHAPRFTERGTIVVFDNLGSDEANGQSRVVEIAIKSRKTVGMWEASGDDFFESRVRGKVLVDDDTVLVQEQHTPGRDATMFSLDCPTKYVSMQCTRRNIFVGKAPEFHYDNAIVVDEPAAPRLQVQ